MKPGAKPHKKKPSSARELAQMLNADDIGPTRLAKKLGVTKPTLYNWMNEFGVKRVSMYV